MIDLKIFNTNNLPYVYYDNLREIPTNIGAIYFVMDMWETYYIGQSINIRERLLKHNNRAKFKQLNEREFYDVLCVAWLEVGNVSLLDPLEHLLINHLKPKLNIRGVYHAHNNSYNNYSSYFIERLIPVS